MSETPLVADWQWSVEIPGVTSSETGGAPRAFLWVPPASDRLRAVVVGQHNMEEEPILEHPIFRAALAAQDFAAIWISPPLDLAFALESGVGRHFDAMLAALAEASGYDEVTSLPIAPLGHSAAAGFPWNFARWAPQRTLAVLSISGQWPYTGDAEAPIVREPALAGIPGLVTIGEYEWADERAALGLKHRAADALLPLTMLAEAGAGHFDVSAEKVAYLALYLRKAAQHRLPAVAGAPLRSIDPAVDGWLADRWRFNESPRVPAAPVAEYAEPDEAFWCFDEEHAVATEKFRADQRGKRAALLGYIQHGAVLPQVPGSHAQVTIPFVPVEDGLTFHLTGTFLSSVPKGRPERWTGLKEGSPIARPGDALAISIDRICGPVQKLSADTFALRFYRMGLTNAKRTAEIWLAATHPGDATFKRSVQQAVLRIPLRNEAGVPQRLTFAPIPNQRADALAGKSLHLLASTNAPADTRARINFYVREGPAAIAPNGTSLTFTALPRRAKFPLKVTVVAWQWGRSLAPLLRTAEPVERTFFITR
ncbi:MAG: hypothetical protein V4773_27755 [Verrucomicrobiota bacterium]